MYHHHDVVNEKQQNKRSEKLLLCNAFHVKTVTAAGLKLSVRLPITVRELLKKMAD
jgi:hypothetical protein